MRRGEGAASGTREAEAPFSKGQPSQIWQAQLEAMPGEVDQSVSGVRGGWMGVKPDIKWGKEQTDLS